MARRCGRNIVVAAVAAAGGLAAGSAGSDVFVAGQIGEVYVGDSHSGGFVHFGGVCLIQTHALAIDETSVWAGDQSGGILRLDLDNGDLVDLFFVPGDSTDVVVHRGDLLVSTSAGQVHRVDPESGLVETTLTAPIAIQAMALRGDDLFVAGTIGEIYMGSADTGGFERFAGLCLAPIQALAYDDSVIYAGDLNGGILSFDLATGDPLDLFFVPGAGGVTAIAVEGADLLVSHPSGLIDRVNPIGGAILDTLVCPIGVLAMETLFAPEDLDQDGLVGVTDLLALLAAWGPCPAEGSCPADLDGTGAVGIADLLALLGAWG